MGSVKNQAIGIPETQNTRNLHERKMIGSKPFYKEYAVEAGKPVVVEAGASSPAHWTSTPGLQKRLDMRAVAGVHLCSGGWCRLRGCVGSGLSQLGLHLGGQAGCC